MRLHPQNIYFLMTSEMVFFDRAEVNPVTAAAETVILQAPALTPLRTPLDTVQVFVVAEAHTYVTFLPPISVEAVNFTVFNSFGAVTLGVVTGARDKVIERVTEVAR